MSGSEQADVDVGRRTGVLPHDASQVLRTLAAGLMSGRGRRKLGRHLPARIQELHYRRSVRIDP